MCFFVCFFLRFWNFSFAGRSSSCGRKGFWGFVGFEMGSGKKHERDKKGFWSTALLVGGVLLLGWATVEIAFKDFLQAGRSSIARSLDPNYDPDDDLEKIPPSSEEEAQKKYEKEEEEVTDKATKTS